jgi:excisionase family DNA binding protein
MRPTLDEQINELFITTTPAARLLNISENGVRRLAERGELPFTRIAGLRFYRREDVLRLAERRKVSA